MLAIKYKVYDCAPARLVYQPTQWCAFHFCAFYFILFIYVKRFECYSEVQSWSHRFFFFLEYQVSRTHYFVHEVCISKQIHWKCDHRSCAYTRREYPMVVSQLTFCHLAGTSTWLKPWGRCLVCCSCLHLAVLTTFFSLNVPVFSENWSRRTSVGFPHSPMHLMMVPK